MTNFEIATRIPLIIRCPWCTASVGQRAAGLVEAVDLYPTLAELAGLPNPAEEGEELNGTSLAPLFADSSASFAKGRDPLSVWPCPARNDTHLMGYSVRVDLWRYTCWFRFDAAAVRPVLSDIAGEELYSHAADTGADPDSDGEDVNLVGDPKHAGR
eukprot:gene7103-6771_t